ncbi:MAG: thiamine pyrophosphate-dependent enzyme [Candidatus Bathyarchaeia archaeon]|jgi:pyruvate ferredoxin oxidoreductase alpha subunit
MPKKDLISGNLAAAHGARLSRPRVIAAYPISPSTTIVEHLASFINRGELEAEYIPVESEHSAMGACIGASLSGVRVFTATASQGLAYMHEFVYHAHGYHLPIVMAIANRTLSTPWATTCDYSDTMAENTSGWLQLFAENAQEVLDTIIQAYKIAEDKRVLLPTMVCMDGFLVSHTAENVEIPDQEVVDNFLPAYSPEHFILDPDNRMAAIVPPRPWVISFEHQTDDCMNNAKDVIKEVGSEYGKIFGREYGLIDKYRCDNAELLLMTMGSMTGTARVAVDELRREGLQAGLVRLRSYRPFPDEELREACKDVRAVAVVDRDVTHGIGGRGGAFFTELKSCLYNLDSKPHLTNFIAGLAGREITIENFKFMASKTLESVKKGLGESVEWLDEVQIPVTKSAPLEKYADRIVLPGVRACAGCGMLLTARHVFQTLGKDTVFTFIPGCAGVTMQSALALKPLVRLPFAEVVFAGTAAVATGLREGLKIRGKSHVNVVGLAGDGGTVDIGLQALSAAAERGESIIYICYDNEAYMNTGIQKSGSTPFGAWTTTTPRGARRKKKTFKKDMAALMAMHRIPYVATASIAYIPDLEKKVRKAARIVAEDKGLAYLHVHAPCPTGWRFPTSETVNVARLAVRSGMWILYEVEEGKMKLNLKQEKRTPVREYLKVQGRFDGLSDQEIQEIQQEVDQNWSSLSSDQKPSSTQTIEP